MNDFQEPKLLAFLCNWCSYAGADLAGVSRIQYPPSIRVVRTMCSGRVDPLFIIKALQEGFDGVMVAGCHIGDCHYQEGNLYTLKRMNMLAKLLGEAGMEKERVHLKWASAAEAREFAGYVSVTTEIIKGLGPFDPRENALRLSALARCLSAPRLRWITGIDRQLTEKSNVYNEKTDKELFQLVYDEAIKGEYQKALVTETLIAEGPITVKELSRISGLPVYTISLRLNELEQAGFAGLHAMEGTTPKFISLAA